MKSIVRSCAVIVSLTFGLMGGLTLWSSASSGALAQSSVNASTIPAGGSYAVISIAVNSSGESSDVLAISPEGDAYIMHFSEGKLRKGSDPRSDWSLHPREVSDIQYFSLKNSRPKNKW